jgi:hypothetical protein
MNKSEYIDALSQGLSDFDEATRRDILLEIEDHLVELGFQHPELSEEELVADLEEPSVLAANLRREAGPGQAGNETPRNRQARDDMQDAEPSDDDRHDRGHGAQPGAEEDRSRHGREGRARITIDGKDLEEFIRDALGASRFFKDATFSRTSPQEPSPGGPGIHRVDLERIPVDGIRRIVFGARSSDVRLRLSTEGFSVHAEREGRVRLHIDNDTPGIMSVRTLKSGDEPGEVVLGVPASVDEILISTVSGDVTVEDRVGRAEIRTASGDVEVQLCSGDLAISTASGDLRVAGASEDIALRSASGSIEIDVDERCNGIVASTASGDILLRCGDTFEATVRCSTVSGDITRNGEDIGAGVFRTGAGLVPVRLSTSSGDIEIEGGDQR